MYSVMIATVLNTNSLKGTTKEAEEHLFVSECTLISSSVI